MSHMDELDIHLFTVYKNS
uniref:Uncharacterized protein n=1 Tax=Arundo donax TaxID=35708 RepID=A0A0A9ASR4_ARUDO